jgi:hypothetical protein
MMFTLAYLKTLGRKPRVHPNGFVQFDIEPNILRLNVWPAEPIPGHPGRIHPIHNHSFDLRSKIILGKLTNDVYVFEPAPGYGDMVLHTAQRVGTHDSILIPEAKDRWGRPMSAVGYMSLIGSKTYLPGESYTLEKHLFHDSKPKGLTATLMMLESVSKRYAPMVAVPIGVEPMNNFSRDDYDEDLLWSIIGQAL